MHVSRRVDAQAPLAHANAAWMYWRPDVRDIVELALVQGRDVGLPDHFHDEDQLTFVMAGQRRFVMGRTSVCLGAGEGACIPAGAPHRSLPQPDGVVCINVYVHPGECDARVLLEGMADAWRLGLSPLDALPTAASVHRDKSLRVRAADVPFPGHSAVSVQAAAMAAGMSREGYSRAFRRTHGMNPQGFGLMSRLNDARQLLRESVPLAEAAVAAGFADQSHLGRCFRRAFGVTPGRYRAG